ncbi:hypothetical protein N9K64_02420 [Rhodobacteraceae bacterium]|nr:hypothetical protein [Paracoccaceae bacterium]
MYTLKLCKFLFYIVLVPSLAFAEFEKENSYIFVSSSSTAQYLASHYQSRFGLGGETGVGSSLDKNNYRIQEPLSMGYHLEKDVNLNKPLDLQLAFDLALNNASITYPRGISYFIEKISVSSKSIEISPNLSVSKSFIDKQFTFEISGGYTFFWSEQRFDFGDWVIYEHENNILPTFVMALSYKAEHSNKIGYYIGVKTLSEEVYIDLGLRFF